MGPENSEMRLMKHYLNRHICLFKVITLAILVHLALSSCAGFFIGREAENAHEKGLALFNQGNFSEAVPFFEKAISLEPDFYSARLYLGRSHLNLHNFREAIPHLRKAYRLSPRGFQEQATDLLFDALLGAAYVELKEGNLETSLNYIRELLSADPKSRKIKEDISRIIVAVATELYKSGKARDAIREYGEAIKADPDNINAYIGLAKALLKNGELTKALGAAEEALSLDPKSREALAIIKDLLKK